MMVPTLNVAAAGMNSLFFGAAAAYLLLLFAVAAFGDRRARQGRSIIGNAWVYALSMAVYATSWTFYGSVGRAGGTVQSLEQRRQFDR